MMLFSAQYALVFEIVIVASIIYMGPVADIKESKGYLTSASESANSRQK